MKTPAWLSRLLPVAARRALVSTMVRAVRRFDGAQFNRLTHSWMMAARSINTELRGDLDALRRRSRDLSKNEPLAVKFLKMVRKNVAGPKGFNFQARVTDDNGKPDNLANNAIEAAWADWCRPIHCDITGRLSFTGLTQGLAVAIARDGEALVRLIDGAPNPYGFALQWLDIERLDTTFHREASNGINQVIMGVEMDGNGRPVAYHLATAAIGRDPTGRSLQRFPAENLLHLYMTDDPEQVRGIPWMHASMIRIHHLKGFQEAAIIAARIGASKMGFFVSKDSDTAPMDPKDVSDGEDAAGIPFTEAEPGQFGMAPPGYEFQAFNPDYPHGNYDPFVKAAKRDIGSGMDVSYHALGNDLEGVNFSSIRSGVLDERDSWMVIQNWLIEHFLDTVHARWLDAALLLRAVVLPNGSPLPASKRQKFAAHEFQGRRWPWVDPLKDTMSSVLAIKNRLADPYTIAAQQGVDLDDVLDGIARFEAAAKAKNVALYIDDAAAMDAAAAIVAADETASTPPKKAAA